MKIVLTGASGFVGRHLQAKAETIAFEQKDGSFIDLRDQPSIDAFFQKVKPDAVIHLAAQSFVPQSFKDPLETFQINFLGTFHLLSALRKNNFKGRFLYIGSGDVYGAVSLEDLPIQEQSPLKPKNPYSVSKIAAEALCYQWSQTEEFEIIMARPFNQIGPGQNENFAASNFAKQIVEIKIQGGLGQIEVGDLNVTRDFTDVRDVVEAYLLLLSHGKNGEVYNVCSNKETSLQFILDQLIELAGLNRADIVIASKNERQRKTQQQRMVGSSEKINSELGWKPSIPLAQTLKDLLEFWEQHFLCVKKH